MPSRVAVEKMYKSVVEELNNIQEQRLTVINVKNGRIIYPDGPPTKESGLYWIYTTYTDEDFLAASPSLKTKSVNFHNLIKRHFGLKNICQKKVDGFRLVYNGIGGTGQKGYGGLRERILEEFRGGEKTGSLAIMDSSVNDLNKWGVSYILWSEIKFEGGSPDYRTFSEGLERLWRIHFGWPLLCTK
jgi:hypothetical protein